MPTQENAPDWIIEEILKGKYDGAGAIHLSSYHTHVLHEQELIDSGTIKTGEPYDANRRKIGESIDPEIKARIDQAHANLPPHHFSDSE
jgi:hypothetical protein